MFLLSGRVVFVGSNDFSVGSLIQACSVFVALDPPLVYSLLAALFNLNSGLFLASGAVGVLFGELEWECEASQIVM